jgi:hypothetical protein
MKDIWKDSITAGKNNRKDRTPACNCGMCMLVLIVVDIVLHAAGRTTNGCTAACITESTAAPRRTIKV